MTDATDPKNAAAEAPADAAQAEDAATGTNGGDAHLVPGGTTAPAH